MDSRETAPHQLLLCLSEVWDDGFDFVCLGQLDMASCAKTRVDGSPGTRHAFTPYIYSRSQHHAYAGDLEEQH